MKVLYDHGSIFDFDVCRVEPSDIHAGIKKIFNKFRFAAVVRNGANDFGLFCIHNY